MGDKWRWWKSHLYRRFIEPVEQDARFNIPEVYRDFISQAEWNAFVVLRSTPKAMEMSRNGKDKAKRQIYFHTTSRKGYDGLHKDMLKDLDSDKIISRAELWKAAHKKKDGEYINASTQELAIRIDELSTQSTQGIIQFHDREDELTTLFGKEHPGRVRASGHFETITSYYKDNRRGKFNSNSAVEIRELREIDTRQERDYNRLNAEVSQMKAMMERMQEKSIGAYQSSPDIASTQMGSFVGSHVGPIISNNTLPPLVQGMHVLMASGHPNNVVARATLMRLGGSGEFIHNDIPLEAGTCAVMVHHVMDESAPLYVPVDDITVLGPAVGYILPWPSLLILPDPQQPINSATSSHARSPRSGGNKQKLQETESICISNVKKMVDYAILTLPKDGLMFLVLHNRIFGSDRQIVFDRQDVIDFAKVNKIGASMISAYIGCLFDKISEDHQLADKYCFVDPQNISSYVDSNARVTMLEEKLMTLTNIDSVVILPYNNGDHWMLAVLDPICERLYWMDPVRQCIRDDIKKVVHGSMSKFCLDRLNKHRVRITVEDVECPMQLDNVQCGYYIMRYLRQIVYSRSIRIPANLFNEVTTYDKKDIDLVREELAAYILENWSLM